MKFLFTFLLVTAGAWSLTGAGTEMPRGKPTFALARVDPKQQQGQHFVFAGSGGGPIHRPGPEHFKLTRVSDGAQVSLVTAYERNMLEEHRGCPRKVVEQPRHASNLYSYNSLFKGVRFQLDNGLYDAKDMQMEAGCLNVFGRAKLEPGVRYRLTWACWPVGALKATEVSAEFALSE